MLTTVRRTISPELIATFMQDMKNFWGEYFNISFDPTCWEIVPPPPELKRPQLFVVPQKISQGGQPLGNILAEWSKFQKIHCKTTIDSLLTYHERDPSLGDYGIWLERDPEPDAKCGYRSADEVIASNKTSSTVIEEAAYGLYMRVLDQHGTDRKCICLTSSMTLNPRDPKLPNPILNVATIDNCFGEIWISLYGSSLKPISRKYAPRWVYPATA